MTRKYSNWDPRQALPGTSVKDKEKPTTSEATRQPCSECGRSLPASARKCPGCGEPVGLTKTQRLIAEANTAMTVCRAVFREVAAGVAKLEQEEPARRARQAELVRDSLRKIDQKHAEDLAARGLTLNGFLHGDDTLAKDSNAVQLPAGIRLLHKRDDT